MSELYWIGTEVDRFQYKPGSPIAIRQGCKCPTKLDGRWQGMIIDEPPGRQATLIYMINPMCHLHGELQLRMDL